MTGEVGALGPALPGYHIWGGVKMGNPYPLANMIGSFALIGKAQRGTAPGRKWLEPDGDGKGEKLRGKEMQEFKGWITTRSCFPQSSSSTGKGGWGC